MHDPDCKQRVSSFSRGSRQKKISLLYQYLLYIAGFAMFWGLVKQKNPIVYMTTLRYILSIIYCYILCHFSVYVYFSLAGARGYTTK